MHDARRRRWTTTAAAEPAAANDDIRLTDEGELARDRDGAAERPKGFARGPRRCWWHGLETRTETASSADSKEENGQRLL